MEPRSNPASNDASRFSSDPAQDPRPNLYGLTFAQLEAYLLQSGEKITKAPFIYSGLYRAQVSSLLDLPSLNPALCRILDAHFSIALPRLERLEDGGDSAKLLLALEDGSRIEAVLMRQVYGNSLCISTQVGCNMACAFCQSGRFKRTRNLAPHELTGQVLAAQRALGVKVTNVVLMGIGEPFDNFDNVMQFLEIASHPMGLALGARHITVSTCGLVPRIEQYAAHPFACLLAVSLHAPDDATRDQLMPVNRRYPVSQVVEAARQCARVTNKKVMLEYVMLDGVNDHPWQARLLAERIAGRERLYVNLIPYNETQNLGFRQSSRARILAFYDELKKHHVVVTMRREFGARLHAACGQLRADQELRESRDAGPHSGI